MPSMIPPLSTLFFRFSPELIEWQYTSKQASTVRVRVRVRARVRIRV